LLRNFPLWVRISVGICLVRVVLADADVEGATEHAVAEFARPSRIAAASLSLLAFRLEAGGRGDALGCVAPFSSAEEGALRAIVASVAKGNCWNGA
jgi:hypothetical protein